jgi:hypothetical protein
MFSQCLRRIVLHLALLWAPTFAPGAKPVLATQSQVPATDWPRWIESVRSKALEYSDSLPDFICSQKTRRYTGSPASSAWQPQDVWEAELSYNQRAEQYSQVRHNGKASRQPLESLGGALSIGEFGSLLRTLFLPESQAEFWKAGEEALRTGSSAVVVGFRVPQERSGWTLSFKKSHSLRVAYRGKVWVDTANSQVLRITQESLDLPPTFPIAYSEATIVFSYAVVSGLEGQQFLLPQTARLIMHERQPAIRSLNVMEFRGYRKFTADVRIVPE